MTAKPRLYLWCFIVDTIERGLEVLFSGQCLCVRTFVHLHTVTSVSQLFVVAEELVRYMWSTIGR